MTEGESGVQSAIRAIEAVRAQWPTNFNSGNIGRLCDLFYAEDARALPPGSPIVAGRERIRELFQNAHNSGSRFELGIVHVDASDDLGYVVGSYTLTSPSATGDVARSHGVTLETFRRQADGTWKCVADMWHGSEA